MTDEELACDQDDLGNFVRYLGSCLSYPFIEEVKNLSISMSSKMKAIDALEVRQNNLIDISYYGPGKNTLLKWRQNLMSEIKGTTNFEKLLVVS